MELGITIVDVIIKESLLSKFTIMYKNGYVDSYFSSVTLLN